MVNSGANGNWISQRLITKYGIPTQAKVSPYNLGFQNGQEIRVDTEIRTLPITA